MIPRSRATKSIAQRVSRRNAASRSSTAQQPHSVPPAPGRPEKSRRLVQLWATALTHLVQILLRWSGGGPSSSCLARSARVLGRRCGFLSRRLLVVSFFLFGTPPCNFSCCEPCDNQSVLSVRTDDRRSLWLCLAAREIARGGAK